MREMTTKQMNEIKTIAKQMLQSAIDDFFIGTPKLWRRGDCQWDSSGELYDDYDCQRYDDIHTLDDMLDGTYTGGSDPTFQSGQGLSFRTVGQEIEDEIFHRLWDALSEDDGNEEDIGDDVLKLSAGLLGECIDECRDDFNRKMCFVIDALDRDPKPQG